MKNNHIVVKNGYYPGLDILRFVSAWLVVACHFGTYAWQYPAANVPRSDLAFVFLAPMAEVGSIGVQIFFLISGFVITASVVGNSAFGFAMRRAIRVFPALWISGLIALLAMLSIGDPPAAALAAFGRYAVLSPIGPYIDGVVWSLVVEAVFYLLMFTVLVFGWVEKVGLVAKILGLTSSVFICILIASNAIFGSDGPTSALLGRFPFKVLLLEHGVFFATGMLICAAGSHAGTRRDLPWVALFLVFCSAEIAFGRSTVSTKVVSLALWWASFGILVESARQSKWISLLGDCKKVLRVGGRMSYTIYLNHYTLGLVLVPTLAAYGLSRNIAFVATLVSVIIVSYLVMEFPEQAIQKRLKRLLRTVERP